MAYLHSFHILGFYTSDIEYWGTVWIGVTPGQRLLSFALGLFANFGLIATPFLRAPGLLMRSLIAVSLTSGLVVSIAWLAPDLRDIGLLRSYNTFLFSVLSVATRIFYAGTIHLNLRFLIRLAHQPAHQTRNDTA